MKTFPVDLVEAALLDELSECFKADAPKVNVGGLSSTDFNDEGALVTTPPAVLVLFDGGDDVPFRDRTRLEYNSAYAFLVLCGNRNLRSTTGERTGAQQMIMRVREHLAGRVLKLDADTKTEPIQLAGVQRWQYDKDSCWLAQRVVVSDIAQFEAKGE